MKTSSIFPEYQSRDQNSKSKPPHPNRKQLLIKKVIGKYPFALIVWGSFIFVGLMRFLPLDADWIVWRSRFMAMGQLIFGIVDIPIHLLFLLFGFSETTDGVIIYLVGLVLLSIPVLVVGALVQELWSRGNIVRFVLIMVVGMNVACGFWQILWGDTIIRSPQAICERFISPTNGIRVMAYPEAGILAGTHYFFKKTEDGGKTWEQVAHFRWDDTINLECGDIKSSNGKLVWEWLIQVPSEVKVYTQDGGKNWYLDR